LIKVSRNTLIWSLFIITSAFYMRQILNFLFKNIGKTGVGIILLVLFLGVGIILFLRILKKGFPFWRIILFIAVLFLGYIYAFKMRILEEKVHLIKYGLLGALAINDFLKIGKRIYLSVLLSLLYVLIVSSIDETVQYFLPYRVGDLRDIGFALIGGVWGMGLYMSVRGKV